MTNTIREQVIAILEEYPETRNSDILLMITIWKVFYAVRDSIAISQLYNLPREDVVKRRRAELNASGLYWPTDLKIAKGRGILEDRWRASLGYPSVAATQTPTREESYTQQPAIAISSVPDDKKQALV